MIRLAVVSLLSFAAAMLLSCAPVGGGGSSSCTGAACGEPQPEQTDPAAENETGNNAATNNPATDNPATNNTAGDDTDYEANVDPPEETGNVDEPPETFDFVQMSDLTPLELERVTALRDAIFDGLDIGGDHYLEVVSLVLADSGVTVDYEAELAHDDDVLDQPIEECPFVKYYDNGFDPNPNTCEYLADFAKVEAYAKLTAELDEAPALELKEEYMEEGQFWREQGAISAMELTRVAVRTDLVVRAFCNQNPTPVESAATKGLLVGRALFVTHFNAWLAKNGHVPDYPTMSSKIQVCNVNTGMLQPARKDAQAAVPEFVETHPLCLDYEPPTYEANLQYGQARIEYEAHVTKGIDDEFSKAAVTVFETIPCNVSDPIVVDLDRDGLELLPIQRGVNFDLWATGRPTAVAWPAADDGLLALDRNGNGVIDNGSELFGNTNLVFEDGFAQLSALDSNLDSVIDAQDARFGDLRVWRDANVNGVTEPGELFSLATLGVLEIPLAAAEVAWESGGNPITRVAHARTNSKSGPLLMGDVFLRTAPHARLVR